MAKSTPAITARNTSGKHYDQLDTWHNWCASTCGSYSFPDRFAGNPCCGKAPTGNPQ